MTHYPLTDTSSHCQSSWSLDKGVDFVFVVSVFQEKWLSYKGFNWALVISPKGIGFLCLPPERMMFNDVATNKF